MSTGHVSGGIVNPDGSIPSGTVTFTPSPAYLLSGANLLPPAPVVCTIDAATGNLLGPNGTAGVDLPATDATNPSGWTYEVVVDLVGVSPWRFNAAIPAGSTQTFAQLAPVPAAQGVPILVGPEGSEGPPGPTGDPGPGPSDTETAAWVAQAGSLTQAAVDARAKAHVDLINGTGMVVFRSDTNYHWLCWSKDGSKLYANDMSSPGGRTLAVSSDNGQTWTRKTAADPTWGPQAAWPTATAGTLLVMMENKLYRTTDDGATWTLVLTLASDEQVLDSGMVQTSDGTLYAGVYASTTVDPNTYLGGAPVYQSVDDGVTWTLHSRIPSTMTGGSGTGAIRHIHGLLAASDGTLWLNSGDSYVESGIWHWEAGAWVRKSPLDTAGNNHRWCAVQLRERDGYFYWGLDTGTNDPGAIMKASIADLSQWTQLADLPTSTYYNTITPDGTILIGAAIENGTGGHSDDTARIWAVDADDTVYEVWAAPVLENSANNRPVGGLRAHPSNGTIAWFGTSLVDFTDPTKSQIVSFLGMLRKGVGTNVERIPKRRTPGVWETKGTVNDLTTTSTAAVLLETVTVDLKGLSCLVLWSAVVSNNTNNARVTCVPVMDAVSTGQSADQRSAFGPAFSEHTLSGAAILNGSVAGQHTINLCWFVSAGTGTAPLLKRSLIVIELPQP